MNHKDTKKIFANWKHNITNRLDEMFVSKLSEKSQDEDDAKDKKDEKVLLGEEEPEELDEISPIPTPTPQEESDLDEEYDPEKADIDNDGKVSDWEEAKGKAAFNESEDNLEEEGEGDFQESMRSKIREAIKKVLAERKLVEPTHSPKELDSTLTQLKESLEGSRMKSRFKKLID